MEYPADNTIPKFGDPLPDVFYREAERQQSRTLNFQPVVKQ